MGKQRTRVLKRQAKKIYEKLPNEFSEDFQENKETLKEYDLPISKVNRNIMAGYLTTLVEESKKEEEEMQNT